VILPPKEEQKIITHIINSLFVKVDILAKLLMHAEKRLKELNQSILAKAFRGELVPQDPNDEPTSQLLKRIKQEKASLESGKKKRARRG
jgi:type I restriction enzyme, S subunit